MKADDIAEPSLPQLYRCDESYSPGPPKALLRGADDGRCAVELKVERPLLAFTLCERAVRDAIGSALPVCTPADSAVIVYCPGWQVVAEAPERSWLRGWLEPKAAAPNFADLLKMICPPTL